MKTSIVLTNVTTEAAAKPIRDALQGQTYMDLIVEVCPFNGSFNVNVGTNRPKTSKSELTGMVLDLMASIIRKSTT